MTSITLTPRDAADLDADLDRIGAVSGVGAGLAAALRAADPAADAVVPAGLAARALARVQGRTGAAASAQLAHVDAEALDAWLADGKPGVAPPRLAPLAALLEAGLGEEALTPPAGDLAARTIERLEADRRAHALAARIDRFRGPSAADADAPAVAGRIGRHLRGGIRQALSAAAVLFIGTALLLPALRQSATEAGRLACLSNLREAGGAFARYAADFDGVLPRVAGIGLLGGANLLPSMGLAPSGDFAPAVSVGSAGGNAQNLGLLVSAGGGYLPADRLVCHGQPGEAGAGDRASAARIGWRMPGSAAYSYQSQAGPEPLRLELARPDLGVLADRNPLFVVHDGRLRLRADLPAMLPSRLHRGEGQNVLSAAGDARWTVRPRMGVSRLPGGAAADHLWAAEGVAPAGSVLPVDITQDAVLLP